jgi:hypothetical protein
MVGFQVNADQHVLVAVGLELTNLYAVAAGFGCGKAQDWHNHSRKSDQKSSEQFH